MNKKGTLFCLLIFLAAAGYFLWSHRHTLLETIFYICASLTALFLLLHCTLLKKQLFAKIAQICLALFALYFIGAAIFIIFKVFILEPSHFSDRHRGDSISFILDISESIWISGTNSRLAY